MVAPKPDSAAEDARFLRTGVLLNMAGYAFRMSLPALSVFVVRLYGPKAFGLFTISQLSLQLVFRAGSLGLDRAALWWIAREEQTERRQDLWSMFFWALVASVFLALVIGLPGAEVLAHWSGDRDATTALRSMALGLVPMALLEMSVHASMGARDMAVRVFVRDVIVPSIQLGGALTLGLLGYTTFGLEVSYLAALTMGAAVAFYKVRRLIERPRARPLWHLPRGVLKYAFPIWLSELANAVVARLDVYTIAQLMDARAVGIYAAVTQVANALRSVRQSFDPVVLALCSKLDVKREPRRFAEGVSQATVAVMLIQLPIWAALFCFHRYLFGFLGKSFEGGDLPLMILATCWLINGVIGLNGVALLGMGRSDLILYDVGFTLVSQFALLQLLTPKFGLVGAASAVALSYVATNVLHFLQARYVARHSLYRPPVFRALALGLGALATMLAMHRMLPNEVTWLRDVAAFAAFLLPALGGYFGWVRPATRQELA